MPLRRKGGRPRPLRHHPSARRSQGSSTFEGAAAEHDAILLTAFEYSPEGVAADRRTVEALLTAAVKSGKPKILIYTSGVLVLGHTGPTPADENASTTGAVKMVAWRPAHEQIVVAAATSTFATAVLRPAFVYGGQKGIIAGYFASATDEGAAVYVGDGQNHMTLVHRNDLAQLYRLAVEKHARGILHGVDGAAPRIAELARVASDVAGKNGATRSMPIDEARAKMGPFADALTTNSRRHHAPRRRARLEVRPPALPRGRAPRLPRLEGPMKLVLLRHGEAPGTSRTASPAGPTSTSPTPASRRRSAPARLLKDEGYDFDVAYTSVLKRAIRTLWLALDEMDRTVAAGAQVWRLNERHYGALQGLNKAETAAKFGDEQVQIWRRSYDIPPPALDADDPRHPARDPRYARLAPASSR